MSKNYDNAMRVLDEALAEQDQAVADIQETVAQNGTEFDEEALIYSFFKPYIEPEPPEAA